MLFIDIDKPTPDEIKEWMNINSLSTKSASELLGISKRQFLRILSGESKAKRIHSLAMQMIWLLSENKKKIIDEESNKNNKKIVKIPIR